MKNTRLKIFFATVVALTLMTASIQAQNDRQAEALLQSALTKEFVNLDVKGAIKQYKEVAETYRTNKRIAATALLRLGQAYEKVGSSDASKAYERIVVEYADQREALREAQARLKVLGAANSSAFTARGLQRICSGRCFWDGITPDGRYLLGFLGIRDLVTGEDRENGGEYRESPVLTADGKQVAYASFPNSGEYELRTAPFSPLEEKPGKLLFRDKEYTYNVPIGWSPDGKEVFALLVRQDDTTVIASIPVGVGEPRILESLEWRWPERISLSPDGRYLAYDAPIARDSRNHDIWALATDGSSKAELVQNSALDWKPLWTPDGKAIVFSSDRSGTVALWRIPVVDGKPQGSPELLRRLEKDINPLGFARNGYFYYQTVAGPGDTDIFTADIDLDAGKVLRPASRAIDTYPGENMAPAYSPDGKRLAYFSRRSISGGFLSIVVRSLESGAETIEIPTAFAGTPNGVAWFPDGQSLGFSAGPSYHRVDLKTGQDDIQKVRAGNAPVLSSDGKKLYYIRGRAGSEGTLLSYGFDTATEKELFRGQLPTGSNVRIAISPDGKQIAAALAEAGPPALTNPNGSANTSSPVLRVFSLDGGQPKTLRSPNVARFTVIRWSEDEKKILVQQGSGQLWWVPVDGGEAQRISAEPFPAISELRRDGKQIANTQTGAPQQIETWVDPELIRSDVPAAGNGIYTVEFDAATGRVRGAARPLDGKSADSSCAPSYSPDGQSIAFKRPGPPNATGDRQLAWVVRSLATGTEKTLPNTSSQCWVAAIWAHDNKSFINGSFLEANGRLYRVDVSTMSPADLRIPHYKPAIALSADDKTLYMTAHDQQEKKTRIVAVDVASGEQKLVWVSPSTVDANILVPLRLAISPDGRSLALILTEGNRSQLVRVGVDGNGYRPLYSVEGNGAGGAALSRGGLAWTKDGRSILFMDADKNGQRLLKISAEGGKPEFTGLTIGFIDAVFDLSPDGRTLAFHSPRAPTVSR